MAQILKFRNQQIGDHLIKEEPATVLATPVAVGTGLFADVALLNADSRNLIYQTVITVSLVRADPFLFNRVARLILELQGLSGRVELYDGASLKVSGDDWFFLSAPRPDKLPGFGGRFIPEWPLLFAGSSPLEDF